VIHVGTGELIGVPPELSVIMTAPIVTLEVDEGTGTTSVVAVLVMIVVDTTVEPAVTVRVTVAVEAEIIVVPTALVGVPDTTPQLVVVDVTGGRMTVLVTVLVLAPITVVTVDVAVPAP